MSAYRKNISASLRLCVKKTIRQILGFFDTGLKSCFYIFPIKDRKFAGRIKLFPCFKYGSMPLRKDRGFFDAVGFFHALIISKSVSPCGECLK